MEVCARSVRGDGHLEVGCEGVRPGRRLRGGARRSRRSRPGRAMTASILDLREHLVAEGVTCVVMEATGDYWKPFYYLLEDLPGFEVMLVNARHVKNLPGRKTDVSDATWLAQLGRTVWSGVRSCRRPPIRQLRDLTRTRTASLGSGPGMANGWRSCSRTPGSSCHRSRPTSAALRPAMLAGLIAGDATPLSWPIWPDDGCGPRSPPDRGVAWAFQRAPRVLGPDASAI